MNRFSILTTLLLSTSAVTAVFAQSKVLPKWTTTNPISTATLSKAVSTGTTLEEARHNAVNILVSQRANHKYEAGSYQYQLIERGLSPIEQHTSIVRAAEQSSFFRTVKTHVGDESCYILCEVSNQEYQAFSDSLYHATIAEAASLMSQAQKHKEEGNLFAATTSYCNAIQGLVPMLHRQLIYEEYDLLELLHEGYLHSLDSIYWTFDRTSCPMVPGEDIPIEIFATATYRNIPVIGLPVSFMLSDRGKTNASQSTDANGKAKVHVTQAPGQQHAELSVQMNTQKLLELPKHIFSGELPLRLMDQLNKASLSLKAFDPTPFYSMKLDREDQLSVGDTLTSIMTRNGFKPVADSKSSDINVKLDCTIAPDGTPTEGKYPMQYYTCKMGVTITDSRTNAVLASEDYTGMRMFVPQNSDMEQLRARALSEMLKRIKHNLESRIREMNYDKRKTIYNLAKVI